MSNYWLVKNDWNNHGTYEDAADGSDVRAGRALRSGVSGVFSAGLFDHFPASAQTDSRWHSGLREAGQVRLLSSQMPMYFGNN